MGTDNMINNVVGGLVAIKIIDVAGDQFNRTKKKATRNKKRKGLLL